MVNPIIIKNEQIEVLQDDIKNMTDSIVSAMNKKQEDKLEQMFKEQQGLMDQVKTNRPGNYYFHAQERYPFERIMHCTICLEDEIAEVRKGIDWKYWKERLPNGFYSNSSMIDQGLMTAEDYATIEQMKKGKLEYIQNEIIDLWHFLIQMSIEAGMDSKKVQELYLQKMAENHSRQERGY